MEMNGDRRQPGRVFQKQSVDIDIRKPGASGNLAYRAGRVERGKRPL